MSYGNFRYLVELGAMAHKDIAKQLAASLNEKTAALGWKILNPVNAWAVIKGNRTLKQWNDNWEYDDDYIKEVLLIGNNEELVEVLHDIGDLLVNYKDDIIEVFSLCLDETDAKELFNVLTYGGRIT